MRAVANCLPSPRLGAFIAVMLRILLILLTLSAGVSSVSAQTVYKTINSAEMNNGYMNVFNLPSDGGAYQFGSGWGIADLNAYFTPGTSDLFMSPNTINDPNSYWYTPSGQNGALGNKMMEANLYAQDDSLAGSVIHFDGTASAYSLATNSAGIPYVLTAFIRDFAPDYSSLNQTTVQLNSLGSFQLFLDTIDDPNRHVQWGLQLYGPNIWPQDSAQLAAAGQVMFSSLAPPPPGPEPSTYTLLLMTGAGALWWARRRR